MKCPYCDSLFFVKNGYAPSMKKRWKCKMCGKTFDEDSGRSFPSTTFPFKFIAFVLSVYQNSTLEKTKEGVDNLLNLFKNCKVNFCSKESVSISTIYKWKKKYGDIYKNLVTKKELFIFSFNLSEIIKKSNDRIIDTNCSPESISYDIIENNIECSNMEVLGKFKEMAEFLGVDPLDYMRKYPEIVDPILKQFKIEVIEDLQKKNR
jgi:transposase-like protein